MVPVYTTSGVLGVMEPTVDNLLSNPRQLADRVILQCQSDCGGLLF